MFHIGPTKRKPITVQRARSLRRRQTVTELLLWRELRNRGFNNLKFRRQVPIGPFIVDFYCAAKMLIIELDGRVHSKNWIQRRDQRRQKYLESHGYIVRRFTNDQVNDRMMEVLREIEALAADPHPCPSPSTEGEGSTR
jgi:ATP-dependent helicase HrpA/adenine-specific DNA-methyltransferase